MPSLVEAHIGIYNYGYPRLLELIGWVSHVKVLQLSGKIMEFLQSAEDYDLPVFHNLIRLELGANKDVGWGLLAEILDSTPNLEVLVFPRGLVKRLRSPKKPYYEFEWDPPGSAPGCLLLCLETIIIQEFLGTKCEMDLVEYLLENASVLKHMIIHFCNFKPRKQESCHKHLLQYPRGSRTRELKFIY